MLRPDLTPVEGDYSADQRRLAGSPTPLAPRQPSEPAPQAATTSPYLPISPQISPCPAGGDDLELRRVVWEGEHAPAADAAGGIPLPAAQNHKRDRPPPLPRHAAAPDASATRPVPSPACRLAYPFFPLASQVLVVRSPAAPAAPLPFLPGDRALCADISRGREAQPIALFNSADDEPAPVFT